MFFLAVIALLTVLLRSDVPKCVGFCWKAKLLLQRFNKIALLPCCWESPRGEYGRYFCMYLKQQQVPLLYIRTLFFFVLCLLCLLMKVLKNLLWRIIRAIKYISVTWQNIYFWNMLIWLEILKKHVRTGIIDKFRQYLVSNDRDIDKSINSYQITAFSILFESCEPSQKYTDCMGNLPPSSGRIVCLFSDYSTKIIHTGLFDIVLSVRELNIYVNCSSVYFCLSLSCLL